MLLSLSILFNLLIFVSATPRDDHVVRDLDGFPPLAQSYPAGNSSGESEKAGISPLLARQQCSYGYGYCSSAVRSPKPVARMVTASAPAKNAVREAHALVAGVVAATITVIRLVGSAARPEITVRLGISACFSRGSTSVAKT
ncbi:MAG: hypothetical protein M1813_007931 [Trichoglossum hirsutum]|nr:MAG: hypothetical protein M1813_007931 [Trichoglossum hirsutum]